MGVALTLAQGIHRTAVPEFLLDNLVWRPNIEPGLWIVVETDPIRIDRTFGLFLYFLSATISYYFVYDHRAMQHPKFLRNQIPLEINQALHAMPLMSALTAPFFVAETQGWTKLYDFPSEAPFSLYNWIQYPLFIAFTDFGIYWIHRALHYPFIYKRFHKPHHKWIISTPYASYAFHPLDGWAQSVPYHVFPILFPLQKVAYLGLFTFVTVWTVMIRTYLSFWATSESHANCLADDGEYATNSPVINGSACHTIHHYYFNYNYGQFTTFWDRVGGSYRKPNIELFDREQRLQKNTIDKQVKEMNQLVTEVEGKDDRTYGGGDTKKDS